MDLTIIIPHRGAGMGLWATTQSCDDDLSYSKGKYNYNYVIVSNGEPLKAESRQVIHHLKKAGRLREHIHSDEPITPPVARQMGAEVADGRVLFFFDNHCLVTRHYFDRAMMDFDKYPIDVLHSTTMYYTGNGFHYHYNLGLEYNFWASGCGKPHDEWRPYQIAAGGHGCIAVSRDVWDFVGGYGPSTLLRGYAGEELLFDLKVWRFGKTVWLDPKLIHHHYAGERGYSRHYTDEYYTNLLVSAHVIGGEKWLYKVFESFITKPHPRLRPQKTWFQILLDAYYRSAEYAREVDKRSVMTLDELLEFFRTNYVGM